MMWLEEDEWEEGGQEGAPLAAGSPSYTTAQEGEEQKAQQVQQDREREDAVDSGGGAGPSGVSYKVETIFVE